MERGRKSKKKESGREGEKAREGERWEKNKRSGATGLKWERGDSLKTRPRCSLRHLTSNI